MGFEVKVHAGRIASLPAVPIGWYLTIDNDPSWNTRMSGSIAVGAAALDLRFFRDFIAVERGSLPGLELEVTAEIVVSEDFQTVRHIPIRMNDLILKKLPQGSSRQSR